MKKTGVEFTTTDKLLKKIFDGAEAVCTGNLADFDGRRVLVEGAGYRSMWPETQPMAGEMYAKRDMEIAVQNQLIFLDYQLPNGRLPGMLHVNTTGDVENQPGNIVIEPIGVTASYGWLQGMCYPQHALNMYYLADLDKAYLQRFYDAFSRYDDYLWRTRDSDGDGCLEIWCEWDTGEDNSSRTRGMMHAWGSDTAPEPGHGHAPQESMDMMGYSYAMRDILAQISAILENGQEEFWRQKAQAVADKVRDYLWIEEKGACYDRDENNEFIDTLVHNNLRMMYFGVFSQEMADRFVKDHLLNPEEFWTPMPLPSIAVNDPLFENTEGNSWAGNPQGLTFQRSILALERYGYLAQITHIGRCFAKGIGEDLRFSQGYDPFTMQAKGTGDDTYGPTALAMLECIAMAYGVDIRPHEIDFCAVESEEDWTYTQIWGDDRYTVKKTGDLAEVYLNDKKQFDFAPGFRVATDRQGKLLYAVRIENSDALFCMNGKAYEVLSPNQKVLL